MRATLSIFIVSSLCYFFSYPGVDNDLWGHLFFGKEIVENSTLPTRNIYAYTAPNHPWINHEWLSEVVFYLVFYFFASPGLVLLKLAIGAMVVWILDLIIRERFSSLFVRAVTLAWTMLMLSPGFNVRPQLFTYLFFAVFLLLFYGYGSGKRMLLYLVPVLMALWVNLHGGFVVGLGALGLFLLFATLGEFRRGLTRGKIIGRLILPAGLSLLALGLNPYGVDLLSFLWRDLLLDRPITEWKPISLLDFSFLEFKLTVLFVLLFSLREKPFLRWDFVLTLLAAFLAFRHQRHTPLFAIVAAPVLAEGVQRITSWLRAQTREGLLVAGILAIASYQMMWIGNIHLKHRFHITVSPGEYPTQAADFLRHNGVRGNLALPFNWGEYMIWKLYPQMRVSIDGRYTTAYPMDVIQDNWEWMAGGKEWKRLLERYPTEVAITYRYHPVTELLHRKPGWVYIYSDPLAFIFVRDVPSQQELLERFKQKRLLPPGAPPIYFPG